MCLNNGDEIVIKEFPCFSERLKIQESKIVLPIILFYTILSLILCFRLGLSSLKGLLYYENHIKRQVSFNIEGGFSYYYTKCYTLPYFVSTLFMPYSYFCLFFFSLLCLVHFLNVKIQSFTLLLGPQKSTTNYLN